MADDKWKQPAAPPPPLFLNKKERDLVKQVNDELVERIIGQQVLYYAIDVKNTNFILYGSFYYEIVTLDEPLELFGQAGQRLEIAAKCIRARKGLFDAT